MDSVNIVGSFVTLRLSSPLKNHAPPPICDMNIASRRVVEGRMALGRREAVQAEMFVAATDLPRSPGHVFYAKLNALLAEADFDRRVEALCEPYYAEDVGRPGIAPGV